MRRDYVPLFGSINTSTKLADLPDHRARLFYVLLLPQCDSWGRCTAEPRQLNARVWPLLAETPKSTAAALAMLVAIGLVSVHELDGKRWIQVPDWEDKAGRVGHSDRRGASLWPDPQPEYSGLSPDSVRTTPVSVPSEERRGEEKREENPPSPLAGGRSRERRSLQEADLDGTCLNTPAFLAAWADWEQVHGKYKPLGLKGQVKRLSDWGHDRAIAAIRYSIAQESQGIYEERMNGKHATLLRADPAPLPDAREMHQRELQKFQAELRGEVLA